jgi:putative tryptophan/tyrosine transport system substrate-binding protein
VRRREFIVTLAGAAVCPARPQRPSLPVIGFLSAGSPRDGPFRSAFREGLSARGYTDGSNVIIEVRLADGRYDRMPGLVAELLALQVKLLVCGAGAGIVAKQATAAVPIVAISAGDPVRAGLVSSLNHPGGNVTAVALHAFSLGPKRFEVLRELVPTAKTIAALVNPNQLDPEAAANTRAVEAAARAVSQHIEFVTCGSAQELEAAFAAAENAGAQALLVMADPLFSTSRERIVGLAAQHRLPTIYEANGSVQAGGLIGYGSSIADGFLQMGIYAGKILDGAKPEDLPVMQAVKVELAINLNTAKQLSITVPPSLLARADEVIE